MNWGTKIAIFYSFFAVSMITAVIYASMQTLHLVSPSYYQEEIAFETRIQEIKNVQNLNSEISVVQNTQGELEIGFPKDLQIIQGKIRFYRPSDANMDLIIPIDLTKNPQIVPISELAKGNWNLQLTWSDAEQDYYDERKVMLHL